MNVGARSLELDDDVQPARVPLALLYPTHAAPTIVQHGPYAIEVAVDAPLADDAPCPLVVISHGNSASPWVFRTLASTLARAGFVVALPEHAGNSRSDNRLAGTPANLANRPRHVRLAIDAAFATYGAQLHADVAVIGHSIGGYTALAIAGGRPLALPNETPDGKAHPIVVDHDARVRALVLLAPAAPWFMAPDALAGVTAPILMFTGAADALVAPDFITRAIAAPQLDHRVVDNAGHFAFLDPFPPAMVSAAFPPSQDPLGFDRAAFSPSLHRDIVAFLRKQFSA